jgi:hypothetical protein
MLQPRAQTEHARVERQLGQHSRASNLRIPAARNRVHIAQLGAQADVRGEDGPGIICKRRCAAAFVDGTKRLTRELDVRGITGA